MTSYLELCERVRAQLPELKLNVVKGSDINPMDHICEFSADNFQYFIHDAGELSHAFDNWTPIAKNINALPKPLKDYIYHVETLCDPAGIVAENTLLADQTKQLDAMIRRIKMDTRNDIATAQIHIANAIQELERDHGSLLAADLEEQIRTALPDLHQAKAILQEVEDSL